MGLFSKIAKAGLAKKVYDELRKPENQAKIKSFVNSAMAKRSASKH